MMISNDESKGDFDDEVDDDDQGKGDQDSESGPSCLITDPHRHWGNDADGDDDDDQGQVDQACQQNLLVADTAMPYCLMTDPQKY